MEDPFRSQRLLYRAVEPGEDEDLFLRIETDPIAYRNSNATINRPQSKASSSKYMKSVAEEMILGVVICLPATQADAKPLPIGCVHLAGIKPNLMHHRSTEIGIEILQPYQGKGYGSEAIRWALEWAFETAGLHRVLIRAFEYNAGAIRLYERLGFQKEGVAREEIWHAGRWWDGVSLSMLDREWRELRDRAAEVRAVG